MIPHKQRRFRNLNWFPWCVEPLKVAYVTVVKVPIQNFTYFLDLNYTAELAQIKEGASPAAREQSGRGAPAQRINSTLSPLF